MAVRFNQMAVLILLTAAALWQRSSAATFVVGDSLGWTVPPNPTSYSDWASTKTFVIGDMLVFNFASGRHDVAEVARSGYDSCSGGNPISVENNSPARITLNSSGDHHFICTFPGHCNGGQKLSVTVRAAASPAPTPVPVPVPGPRRSPAPSSPPPSSSVVPSPAPSRESMTYIVGDSSGWTVPSSVSFYESWARDKTFFVGDVLEFNFAIQRHDVAEVTRENFDRCSGDSPRSNSTNPPVRITLSEAGEHFFICTFAGHCGLGQKLALNVTGGGGGSTSPPSIATPPSNTVPSTPSPTTAPPPPSAAASIRTSGFSAAILAVALAMVF